MHCISTSHLAPRMTLLLLSLASIARGGELPRAEPEAVGLSAEPTYPVKVSTNGRYFVDQKGTPVFWLGTTQCQLFREYAIEDARTIIEKSKEKGFAFAQVMLGETRAHGRRRL